MTLAEAMDITENELKEMVSRELATAEIKMIEYGLEALRNDD